MCKKSSCLHLELRAEETRISDKYITPYSKPAGTEQKKKKKNPTPHPLAWETNTTVVLRVTTDEKTAEIRAKVTTLLSRYIFVRTRKFVSLLESDVRQRIIIIIIIDAGLVSKKNKITKQGQSIRSSFLLFFYCYRFVFKFQSLNLARLILLFWECLEFGQ